MDALLQFAHASESKDLLLPAWATSSFTTVAGQGWLAGPKPSLDAFEHVATGGSAIKPSSPIRATQQGSATFSSPGLREP